MYSTRYLHQKHCWVLHPLRRSHPSHPWKVAPYKVRASVPYDWTNSSELSSLMSVSVAFSTNTGIPMRPFPFGAINHSQIIGIKRFWKDTLFIKKIIIINNRIINWNTPITLFEDIKSSSECTLSWNINLRALCLLVHIPNRFMCRNAFELYIIFHIK